LYGPDSPSGSSFVPIAIVIMYVASFPENFSIVPYTTDSDQVHIVCQLLPLLGGLAKLIAGAHICEVYSIHGHYESSRTIMP
jgi:hypothetical protein